jgi:hypothetical protein
MKFMIVYVSTELLLDKTFLTVRYYANISVWGIPTDYIYIYTAMIKRG